MATNTTNVVNFTHPNIPEKFFGYFTNTIACIVLLIGFVGFAGNILTILILIKEKMRSFSLLLCSMFTSDCCLILTTATFVMLDRIGLEREKAKIAGQTIQVFIGISGGTAAVVGIERSIAILLPVWYHQTKKLRHTVITITAIIVLNLGFEVTRQIFLLTTGETRSITFRIADQLLRRVLPFFLIATGNIMMAIGLYKSRQQRKEFTSNKRHEINISKSTFLLIIVYFICMIPGSISVISMYFGLYTKEEAQTAGMITIILEMTNASVNFLVYALTGKCYRKAYIHIVCFCRGNGSNDGKIRVSKTSRSEIKDKNLYSAD